MENSKDNVDAFVEKERLERKKVAANELAEERASDNRMKPTDGQEREDDSRVYGRRDADRAADERVRDDHERLAGETKEKKLLQSLNKMSPEERHNFLTNDHRRFDIKPGDLMDLHEKYYPSDNSKVNAAYGELTELAATNQLVRSPTVDGELAPGEINIADRELKPLRENKAFWSHHSNSPDFYQNMARQYPDLRQEIADGRTVQELKDDPKYKDSAGFWFSKSDKITVTKYGDHQFIDNGKHRYVLAKHYNPTQPIPVEIHELKKK